jgi:hypothetical protein
MRIDSTHRPWMIATLITLGCIAATFMGSMAAFPDGPRGGSLTGIAYGVVGYGLMLYAALLGLRKKVPVWRVGRAQTWMRGHLWLGFLSLPLILFHCAFTWKGPLNSLLMVLLFITVGSGILGAALQHFVPNFMTRSVPLETIYEEIPHVRRQLCDEADSLAASISGSGDTVQTLQTEIDPVDRARFAAVYTHTIRPVLHQPSNGPTDSKFENLAPAFDSLRKILPLDVHPMLKDLESICEEQHQLERQRRIHLWLHGWLLVHVPLSVALLVLGAVHGVMALRY